MEFSSKQIISLLLAWLAISASVSAQSKKCFADSMDLIRSVNGYEDMTLASSVPEFGPFLVSEMTHELVLPAGAAGAAGAYGPTEACSKLAPRSLSNKIVLIQRGTCSDGIKIDNAAAAGAKAVLLFNTDTRGKIFKSRSTQASHAIPARMVSLSVGRRFQYYLTEQYKRVTVSFRCRYDAVSCPTDLYPYPRNCVDVARSSSSSSYAQDGIYCMSPTSKDADIIRGYCKFDHRRNIAWTLLRSFRSGNPKIRNEFQGKETQQNYPVETHNADARFQRYSLAKEYMHEFVGDAADLFMLTCNLDTSRTKDYAVGSWNPLYFKAETGKCVKMEEINIRGISCRDCDVGFFQSGSQALHVNTHGTYCNGLNLAGLKHPVPGAQYFGSYKVRDPNFSCTQTWQSTTNWWVGHSTLSEYPVPPPYRTPSPIPQRECPRLRKSWKTLTRQEKQLFVDGVLELHKRGIYESLVETHRLQGHLSHRSPLFLPWHRHFLWQFETSIRSLGPKYECFSLAYWDWSAHSEEEIFESEYLGSGARKEHETCVPDGAFNSATWMKGGACGRNSQEGCCLTRDWYNETAGKDKRWEPLLHLDATEFQQLIGNAITYEQAGIGLEQFGHPEGHLVDFCDWSAEGVPGCIMLHSSYSPWDPLFFLHHTFVDYLYGLWQVCHGHDNIGSRSPVSPDVFYTNEVWNQEMSFKPMSDQDWAYPKPVRPRDVHDNPAWGVVYAPGEFGSHPVWLDVCQLERFNSSWFREESSHSSSSSSSSSAYTTSGDPELNRCVDDYRHNRTSLTEFSRSYAKRSCELKHDSCRPSWDYEKCTSNEVSANMELDYLLTKPGVHNSTCLQNIRRHYYAWIEGNRFYDDADDQYTANLLLKLCNGHWDGNC